jgi:hypothetical protein
MESDESLKDSTQGDREALETAQPPPLIGSVGAHFIRSELSSAGKKPQKALAEIRERCSLRNKACAPLITMLELQGVPTCNAHRSLLEEVRPCAPPPLRVCCLQLLSLSCTPSEACCGRRSTCVCRDMWHLTHSTRKPWPSGWTNLLCFWPESDSSKAVARHLHLLRMHCTNAASTWQGPRHSSSICKLAFLGTEAVDVRIVHGDVLITLALGLGQPSQNGC